MCEDEEVLPSCRSPLSWGRISPQRFPEQTGQSGDGQTDGHE